MLRRDVFRHVGTGVEKLQMDLQGGIAQQAGELGLRLDLCGHQIEDQDLQGADVLGDGPGLGHDKDVFTLQSRGCRQIVGYFDGHIGMLLCVFYRYRFM